MDALFNALTQYIDFLVLGAVSIPILCTPFGLWGPLQGGWKYLYDLGKNAHTFIQFGLISGSLFAGLYFSGYMLNAIGHAFLYRAHLNVIHTAEKSSGDHPEIPRMGANFYLRAVPLVGPLLGDPLNEEEVQTYRNDAVRQIYWGVCDPKSLDDFSGGAALKELRLLRGVVGLTQVLVVLCLTAFIFRIGKIILEVFKTTSKGENKSFGIMWPVSSLLIGLLFYFLGVIPAYWDDEFDMHSTVWAALPESPTPDSAHFKELLPCLKFSISMQRPKSEDGAEVQAPTSSPTKKPGKP